MSRTTVTVFVVAFGAVFGLLVLTRPQPLNRDVNAFRQDQVLRIEAGRTGPRWRYIVVHHSKTLGGSGEMFDRYYREAWGQRLGMGWHFLVEQGAGKPEELIYTGRRWRDQADGYHTFDSYDRRSIGVCVVGLTRTQAPSQAQMRALTALVRSLQKAYRIPPERVLLHRDLAPESQCPGPAFPVERFRQGLLGDV